MTEREKWQLTLFCIIVFLSLLIAVAIRGAVVFWETDVVKSMVWLWFAGSFFFSGISVLVIGLLKLFHGEPGTREARTAKKVERLYEDDYPRGTMGGG